MLELDFTILWKRSQILLTSIIAALLVVLLGFEPTISQNTSETDEDYIVGIQKADNISVYSNLVTIQISNLSLAEALEELAAQLRVGISYNPETMPDITISLDMTHAPVYEVIYALLEGTNLEPVLPPGKDVIVIREKDQPKEVEVYQDTIQGTVVDADTGEPLPGVNILISGTTDVGTTTNVDGEFVLEVENLEETLIISYIGYERLVIAIDGRTELNIQLSPDIMMLEDLVVVGYGVRRAETVTGSVSVVQSEEIVSTRTENLVSNIQGKIPGLQVRQRTGEPGVFDNLVSIRGYGDPLIVIDGIPRDGVSEFAQLNPNDVENISILKDASAAIYGMNAANGVIIVTTKRGRPGDMEVSYSGLTGWKSPTGIEQTVDAYTYRLMRNEMDRNIGNAPRFSDDILEKYRVGEPGYTDTNWIDLTLYDRVFSQQHDVSIRGGSERVRYFTSVGYTEDNGLLRSDIQQYDRYNFRSTVNADLSDYLTLNATLSGRYSEQQQPRNAFLWVFKPIMVNDRGQNYHTIANENNMTALPPENTNPYAMMDPELDGYRRSNDFQYQSNIELIYDMPFIDGLAARAIVAYDGNQNNSSTLQKSYGLYDYYTNQRVTTYGSDRYQNSIQLFKRLYSRIQLDYTVNLEDHNFDILGVAEVTRTRTDYLQGQRFYDDIFTHDILNQASSTTATNNGYRDHGALAAYLTRINYDYQRKYLLEVVARYDGSYRYAPGNRWAFFPSVSVGWRLSEESFIADNFSFIDNLRLRASYGESGLDAGNPFEFVPGYSTASGYAFNPGQMTIGMRAPGVVNDNLSWITAKTANLGLDFELWEGVLGGSVDLFERENSGLLATRIQSVPNTFGASFPQENIDSDLVHGIEVMLSHSRQISSDFSYYISANATYSRHKILHEERGDFRSSMDRWLNGNEDRYTGRMRNYEADGRYTTYEAYETAPLLGGSQGNSKMLPGSYRIVDLNGDGIINGNDRNFDHWGFGNINPPLQFGMTLASNYKAFDINVVLQGATFYTINFHMNDIWGYGRYPSLHQRWLDRWHPVDTNADPYNPATEWNEGKYQALRSNTSGTTDGLRHSLYTPSATYLRIKSVELGYNLPVNISSKLGINDARVFVTGFNLYTFTSDILKQIDPEKQEYDWNANLTYPIMRTFNIGLNLNF